MMRTGVFAVLALIGCGFRPLGTADMNGDGAQNGGDLSASGGGPGPGPWGALPTGYCCASKNDCRERNCQSFGCSDSCFTDDGCNTRPGYHCVGATMFDP